ncbi:hypothetical protein SeLEV6574_g06600 [Synchytrium endobioticum]|uniref:Uncharacterized protein n=1 Tax=Synchytrium endobioticum TaxID=286115 RepID=A0A507CMX1_9FUNG|nr:hypothetical protein SeLEV6574_g06600 [Synchytrium endobioticum]
MARSPSNPPLDHNPPHEMKPSQIHDQLKKSLSAPAFIPTVNSLSLNDTFSLSSAGSSTNTTPLSSRASTPTFEHIAQGNGHPGYCPSLQLQYTATTSFGHLDDRDAMYIFEGVRNGNMIKFERPLTEDECRKLIKPGSIFVFDESTHFKSWVDGRIWSEVVQSGAFAFFKELVGQSSLGGTLVETGFVKKCTSLYVPEERVFRHLISYYHHDTLHLLPRPTFDPCLLLHPSYFGRLDSYADAQILVDGIDYGILHRARRPPLSFEIESLIVAGVIFVWDDVSPGSRCRWGDGKLWQPCQIAGSVVVFREMETVIMDDPSLSQSHIPSHHQQHPQQSKSGSAQNAVMKIVPKPDGLIKKVTTISSNKSGRIYQVIAYSNESTMTTYNPPSLDLVLQEKIVGAVAFLNSLGGGLGTNTMASGHVFIDKVINQESLAKQKQFAPNLRLRLGTPPSKTVY